jgi:hypothetical protein
MKGPIKIIAMILKMGQIFEMESGKTSNPFHPEFLMKKRKNPAVS